MFVLLVALEGLLAVWVLCWAGWFCGDLLHSLGLLLRTLRIAWIGFCVGLLWLGVVGVFCLCFTIVGIWVSMGLVLLIWGVEACGWVCG